MPHTLVSPADAPGADVDGGACTPTPARGGSDTGPGAARPGETRERIRVDEESRRLAAFSRVNPYPILECDLQGAVTYANPAAQRLLGELALTDPARLLPSDHAAVIRGCVETATGTRSVEHSVGTRVLSWAYHPHPALDAVHLFGEDVTERKRVEARLVHEALHDPLTGLPNRHFFMERLENALLRFQRREGLGFAVLFLDLDRFKVVNDSLGHHVGDELLMAVAARLKGTIRLTDMVARFGGDEFAILVEELSDVADARRIAERVDAVLSQPINLSGYEVFTSASVGIALCSTGHERPEHLLRNADMAMYQAKGAGATRCEVFDRGMHARALSRLQMETDLWRALHRGEFALRYQPIVSLRTGRIAGFEALLRWNHPERGLVMPDAFIPLAEETGVIFPLGGWALRQACQQMAEWRRRHPEPCMAVSVNLSPRQFAQRDLVEQVHAALRDSGLQAERLKLEITESAILDGAGSPGAMLRQLRDMGVEVQLDDFGTGYSSLSCLHRLPLNALKVDRSFVAQLGTGAPTESLVRSIALLAQGMHMAVIAEGVETEAQLAELRAMGCDYAQGYLIAHPLEPETITDLLATDPRW